MQHKICTFSEHSTHTHTIGPNLFKFSGEIDEEQKNNNFAVCTHKSVENEKFA